MQIAKICYICKEKLKNKWVRDHCYYAEKNRGAAYSTGGIKYSVPKIPVVFHNGSN